MTKKLFDFVASFIGLIVFSPLFIISGLLIEILTPGSIFFIQTRIGLKGKEFKLLKFRTMKEKPENSEGSFDPGDKSSITPLGKVLRRTKIDEMPQLLNVLMGDMSIVGPRPEVKKWTKVYPDKWAKVHSVKPGITDNAAIEFFNEEELLSQLPDPEDTYRNVVLPRKLDLYIDYVNNHTICGDIMIIFKTIQTIFVR